MSRNGVRSTLKAIAGGAIGIAFWRYASAGETSLLAGMADAVYRLVSSDTVLYAKGVSVDIGSSRAIAGVGGNVRADLLTFNTIVFGVLAGFSFRATPRYARRLVVALALLLVVHLFALIVTSNSIVLATLVAQKKEVSAFAWNVSFALSQGYQIVLGYALVFAIWWGLLRRAD